MFKELIERMKEKGIIFAEGLNKHELDRIYDLYKLKFPDELLEFYTNSLPISKGFYNWKDYNTKNVDNIKAAICRPRNDLIEFADEIYWNDDWGEEPSKIEIKIKIISELLHTAPQLIPIYSHRYLPIYEANDSNPVFSIYGTDIIYYGKDLMSYFKVEFGEKKYNEIDYSNVQPIPFWSDLL